MPRAKELDQKEKKPGRIIAERVTGRPSEYSEEIGAAICKAVEEGLPEGIAGQLNGFSRSAVSDWKAAYPAFAEGIAQARARRTQKRVSLIAGAVDKYGNPDWRAQLALLQAEEPDTYGAKAAQVNVQTNVQNNIAVTVEQLTEWQDLRAKARGELTGGAGGGTAGA